MSLQQITFAAQIIAILSVLLLAAGYLKTEPKAASARVFALTALFIVFYLLGGMSGGHLQPGFRLDLSGWTVLRQSGAAAISGLFMIYCFLIFQERRRFPRLLAIAYALQVGTDFSIRSSGALGWLDLSSAPVQRAFDGLSLMQLLFAGCAIYWTVAGWRADMVEDRRVFRWVVIGLQGVMIFTVILVENFLLERSPLSPGAGRVLITYIIAIVGLGMVLTAMRFDYVPADDSDRGRRRGGGRGPPQGPPKEPLAFDEEGFNRLFKEGFMYREAGLTIAVLAKRLQVPEYRLRAFIHKQLGFRNFNAMLHKYRIAEAAEALSEPSRRDTSILTIALSVGYQSITPFNNAFRETMGVTPSEFRRRAIEDSV